MEYFNKLLRKGANKKPEVLEENSKSHQSNIRETKLESEFKSIQHSTPKKHPDCDTESDTTAEYESAGEASPWGREPSLSALADCLEGVHLSNCVDTVQSKLNQFPFSPISAEDESDEEVTAITSNSSQSTLTGSLSFMEENVLQQNYSFNDGQNTPFVVIVPSQINNSVNDGTLNGNYKNSDHRCIESDSRESECDVSHKSVIYEESKLEERHEQKSNVTPVTAEFHDAGPACSFHSTMMNSIEGELISETPNSPLVSNNSLIIKECRNSNLIYNDNPGEKRNMIGSGEVIEGIKILENNLNENNDLSVFSSSEVKANSSKIVTFLSTDQEVTTSIQQKHDLSSSLNEIPAVISATGEEMKDVIELHTDMKSIDLKDFENNVFPSKMQSAIVESDVGLNNSVSLKDILIDKPGQKQITPTENKDKLENNTIEEHPLKLSETIQTLNIKTSTSQSETMSASESNHSLHDTKLVDTKCAFSQNPQNISENVLKFANEKHPICLEESPEALVTLLPSTKVQPHETVSSTEFNIPVADVAISEMCNLIETTFNNALKENLDEICENITITNLKPISLLSGVEESEVHALTETSNIMSYTEEDSFNSSKSISADNTVVNIHENEKTIVSKDITGCLSLDNDNSTQVSLSGCIGGESLEMNVEEDSKCSRADNKPILPTSNIIIGDSITHQDKMDDNIIVMANESHNSTLGNYKTCNSRKVEVLKETDTITESIKKQSPFKDNNIGSESAQTSSPSNVPFSKITSIDHENQKCSTENLLGSNGSYTSLSSSESIITIQESKANISIKDSFDQTIINSIPEGLQVCSDTLVNNEIFASPDKNCLVPESESIHLVNTENEMKPLSNSSDDIPQNFIVETLSNEEDPKAKTVNTINPKSSLVIDYDKEKLREPENVEAVPTANTSNLFGSSEESVQIVTSETHSAKEVVVFNSDETFSSSEQNLKQCSDNFGTTLSKPLTEVTSNFIADICKNKDVCNSVMAVCPISKSSENILIVSDDPQKSSSELQPVLVSTSNLQFIKEEVNQTVIADLNSLEKMTVEDIESLAEVANKLPSEILEGIDKPVQLPSTPSMETVIEPQKLSPAINTAFVAVDNKSGLTQSLINEKVEPILKDINNEIQLKEITEYNKGDKSSENNSSLAFSVETGILNNGNCNESLEDLLPNQVDKDISYHNEENTQSNKEVTSIEEDIAQPSISSVIEAKTDVLGDSCNKSSCSQIIATYNSAEITEETGYIQVVADAIENPVDSSLVFTDFSSSNELFEIKEGMVDLQMEVKETTRSKNICTQVADEINKEFSPNVDKKKLPPSSSELFITSESRISFSESSEKSSNEEKNNVFSTKMSQSTDDVNKSLSLTSAENGLGENVSSCVNTCDFETNNTTVSCRAVSSQPHEFAKGEMESQNENDSSCLNQIRVLPKPTYRREKPKKNGTYTTCNKTGSSSNNKSSIEKKSYEDLLDKCLQQERLLSFDDSMKEESNKVINDLANPYISQSCSFPSSKANSSEAGPTTAAEDFNSESNFQSAINLDFEHFSKIQGNCGESQDKRESLYHNFDSLSSALKPERLIYTDQKENLPADRNDAAVTPQVSAKSGEEKLISITQEVMCSSVPDSNKPQTKLCLTSGSATPTIRQEILSKEMSKLQDLMIKQESSYQEQIAVYVDEINVLRQKVIELERQQSGKEVEEKLVLVEAEATKLKQQLEKAEHEKRELVSIIHGYEDVANKIVKKRDEDHKKLQAERDNLQTERDEALQHLRNMEIAFNDVHQKYEKCKEVIELFKQNEVQFKKALSENEKAISQIKESYQKLKEHSSKKLEEANIEIREMRRTHQGEIARLGAINRKMEIQMKSLEDSLEQKKTEVKDLTKICDELITKFSQK